MNRELRVKRAKAAPGKPLTVTLWGNELAARCESDEAHEWFSEFLGVEGVRLVRPDAAFSRPAADNLQRDGMDGEAAFADVLPFLVVGDKSYDELRRQLPAHVDGSRADVRRLRPNIVVGNTINAHEEDHWGSFTVGRVAMHVAKQVR